MLHYEFKNFYKCMAEIPEAIKQLEWEPEEINEILKLLFGAIQQKPDDIESRL